MDYGPICGLVLWRTTSPSQKLNSSQPFRCCLRNVGVFIWPQLCQILDQFQQFFMQTKLENKFYKWGMHWLTYYINLVLLMTSKFVLTMFAVNHAINKWRHCLSACVDTEGGHSEYCLWLLLSLELIFPFFCCECKWTKNDSIYSCMQNFFTIKMIKSRKNRLRLAKVIVIYKMSCFYGPLCTYI